MPVTRGDGVDEGGRDSWRDENGGLDVSAGYLESRSDGVRAVVRGCRCGCCRDLPSSAE